MTGHGAKFGRKKEDAIVALLTHRTIEEAARAVNVSTKTLLRWQKEPEFDAAYRAAKRAAFGQSIARLHHLSSAAVSTLGKIMLDSAAPPSTRVRAADQHLGSHGKGHRDRGHRGSRDGTRTGRAAGEPEAMKTVSRRISKLEERFVPRVDRQGRNIGEVLRERLRRYLAQQGLPPEPARPLQSVIGADGRPRTIGQLLRHPFR
jgi:hypothetical protein